MVRRTRKDSVQGIIKNLVDSEIPEIQAAAKQLAEWTKQLEEHSWKLQHYASEIESIAAAEVSEIDDEVSLAELVKDLEITLAQLRGAPGKVAALPEGRKTTPVEKAPVQKEIVKREPVKEVDREERPTLQMHETYTTPEGFVVRRVRH